MIKGCFTALLFSHGWKLWWLLPHPTTSHHTIISWCNCTCLTCLGHTAKNENDPRCFKLPKVAKVTSSGWNLNNVFANKLYYCNLHVLCCWCLLHYLIFTKMFWQCPNLNTHWAAKNAEFFMLMLSHPNQRISILVFCWPWDVLLHQEPML